MPFGVVPVPAAAAAFAPFGAFFTGMDGEVEGDGRVTPAPFVWMLAGIGRLGFPVGTGGGTAVATGPIALVGQGFAGAGCRESRCTRVVV